MNEQKKKGSIIKKAIVGFLAVALIVGSTIAGTLAYLSTVTETVPNTFVASGDIKLLLAEVNYNYDSANKSVHDAMDPDPSKYTPNTIYKKDPVLINDTADGESEEWVAMRVDYKKGDSSDPVTYEDLTIGDYALIRQIEFDRGNWIEITSGNFSSIMSADVGYQIFVYKKKLDASDEAVTLPNYGEAYPGEMDDIRTTPLFQQIQILDQDTLKVSYSDGKYPKFSIDVKGAAIKNEADLNILEINSDEFDNTDSASYKIVDALVKLLADPVNPGN